MSSITLSHVKRAYNGVLAVDDVSLVAPEAKVLAMLGPSGSGKSTIMRLIAGLEPLAHGEIRIGDERISTAAHTLPTEQRRIGMVFQDYSLFPHLNAGANVAFGLDKLGRAERDALALQWLDRVGLKHRAQAFPHELSGGEQQRVALARAFGPRPSILFADEPTGNLDAATGQRVMSLILDLHAREKSTLVLVTHDPAVARLAQRRIHLRAGRVERDERDDLARATATTTHGASESNA